MAKITGRLTRRDLGRGIAGVAAATGLTARRAEAKPVTLKMWMHLHPPRLPVDKRIIAAFEQANPDVTVQYEVFPPSEYGTKLLTAFAAGAGPDFFNWSSSYTAEYHHSGIIAPVDFAAMGYPDEHALTSQYAAGFQGARFDNKLFGVPSEVSNYACYSNNQIWGSAHLDPMKDFPKTWEELTKVADTLTMRDHSGVPVRRGYDFDWSSPNIYYLTLSTMMHQLGVDVVDEATGRANLDTDAARQVMQYYAEWVRKLRLGGPQYIESRIAFLDGKLGSEGSFGVWGIPQMHTAKLDFSVSPAPRWTGGTNRGFDAYAFYMMVNARTPAPAQHAAWKLARAYVDHAPELFQAAGLFVPREDVMATEAFKSDPWVSVFMDELKLAKFSPRLVGFDQVVGALVAARDQIIEAGQPVGPVLKDLNAQVNAIIQQELKT
ncbi:MAG TPA: extracellular solute-binding protein [Acetobacteraceae bacterium]